jgi:isoquinoline 1-oxidoreductase subunit alpha
MLTLNINGKVHEVDAESETPLLWVIREQIGLTGTKYGCGIAQCGACSVHLDGAVTRSCSIRVGDLQPTARIVTIEGLSDSTSHPVQRAWAELECRNAGTVSQDKSWQLPRSSLRLSGRLTSKSMLR